MIRKTWIVVPLTVVVALLTGRTGLAAPPCANALAQRAVCVAANERALEIMTAYQLEAVMVVQDVRTGAVVAFTASQPSKVDVATPISPLSLSKLWLAASWWDNRQPDSNFDSTKGTPNAQNPDRQSRLSVHEILVGGNDFAGKRMAIALRKSIGTKTAVEDFKRYGFGPRTNSSRDETFWDDLARTWKTRLLPAPAYVALNDETKDEEWAEALSIGEIDMQVTALHVSRFLQAVGNDGVMLPPGAREEESTPATTSPSPRGENSIRVMQESTARRLQSAMCDCVQRGTAKSIARALEETGWQIGGKTGSGPALLPKGPQVDGWFGGLIFDPQRRRDSPWLRSSEAEDMEGKTRRRFQQR